MLVNAYNTGYFVNPALAGDAVAQEDEGSSESPEPDPGADTDPSQEFSVDPEQVGLGDNNEALGDAQNVEGVIAQADGAPSPSSSSSSSSMDETGVSIAGDAAVDFVGDTTKAYFENSGSISGPFTSGDAVTVSSKDDSILLTVSGAVAATVGEGSSAEGSTAFAGSLSADVIKADTEAYLSGITLTAPSLSLSATHGGFIGSFTGGGSGNTTEDGLAIAGSVAVDVILPTTVADVQNSNLTLTHDSTINATDTTPIYAIAGSAAYGGGSGYGVAIALNLIGAPGEEGETEAYVASSTVTVTDGTLDLSATVSQPTSSSDPGIVSIAGAVGISGGESATDIGLGGLVAVNVIYRETESFTKESNIDQEGLATATEEGLTLDSEDDSQIIAAGAAVGLGNGTAVGAAIGFNLIHDTTESYLDSTNATLAGGLSATATANATIGSGDAGVAVGDEGQAVGGSIGINVIADKIEANLLDQSVVTAGGIPGATITATDNSLIVAIVGGVAGSIGGQTAIGAALGYNLIGNTIQAAIDASTLGVPAGGLDLAAISAPLLIALAAGVALSAGSSNFTLGGSITVNSIVNQINAFIDDGATGEHRGRYRCDRRRIIVDVCPGRRRCSFGRQIGRRCRTRVQLHGRRLRYRRPGHLRNQFVHHECHQRFYRQRDGDHRGEPHAFHRRQAVHGAEQPGS